jgi:hypothetical protein
MQTPGTTVVVDVRQDLAKDVRQSIADYLDQQQGVNSARFSQHINRLMLVQYDPRVISAQRIKYGIDQFIETDGPATCLIGM